jgi:hypothetical protein
MNGSTQHSLLTGSRYSCFTQSAPPPMEYKNFSEMRLNPRPSVFSSGELPPATLCRRISSISEAGFECHDLGGGHTFWTGHVPA